MHYHLSGVCGTAMGTLAMMLQKKGHQVTGSDSNFYPPMSDLLAQHSIKAFQGYHEQNLVPHPDKVIIGNALSRGNKEVEYCLNQHIPYQSSAEVLKENFIEGNRSVVVVGTHGKTTTASLCAHVLEDCGCKPGFFIGGAPGNFNVSGRATQHSNSYFVVEGDEYDTAFFDKRSKFFHYRPDFLLFNNLEFDHEDIFSDLAEIKKAFRLMLRQIPSKGKIFANGDDQNVMEVLQSAFSPCVTVGFGEQNHYQIKNMEYQTESNGMVFSLCYENQISNWKIPLMGEHNVRNAALVICFSLEEKLKPPQIQQALHHFIHTARRQQLLTNNPDVLVYDDFAHHPTAIEETVKAIQLKHPDKKLICAYEPRSNTSVTKTHQNRMGSAFLKADCVLFSDLYRAEKIPVENQLNLLKIVAELREMKKEAFFIPDPLEIMKKIQQIAQKNCVILVMSQGSFSNIARNLATYFDNNSLQ